MLVQEKDKLLEELIGIVGEKYATNDQAICIGYLESREGHTNHFKFNIERVASQ